MAEQVLPSISRQLAVLHLAGAPLPGGSSHTGGTPRYGLHRTSDGGHVAVAAIEEKFWRNCCDAIDLPVELRAPKADPGTVKAAIAERLGAKTVAHWREAFQGEDFSVEAVADLAAARAVHTRRARCLRPRRSHGERRGVSGPSATAGSRITLARHTLRARVRRAGARGEAVGRDRDRPSDRRRMRTR